MFNSNYGFEADHLGGTIKTDSGGRTTTTALDNRDRQMFGRFDARSAVPPPKATDVAKADAADDDKAEGGSSGGGMTAKGCLKRFMTLMLSHFGTMVIVILYILMGGFLFQYLERENEISGCSTKYEKYSSKRNEAVDRVYNMAQGGNASLSKSAIFEELSDFSKDIFQLGVNPTLNCSTLGIAEDNWPQWSFANAAYFSATIITTIGYGHIAPATQWGQIVCMIYAILGIPLMLLFLTKIGEPTAMLFRAFYLNIFCCKCFVKKLPHESKNFNKEVEQQQQQQQQTSWKTVEDGVTKQAPAKVTELVVVEDEDEEEEEEEVVNIPITVTIMLLIMYILIGAAVFRVWEEWTLIEGTYFSFITLSTVGFGDYVPGKDGPFNSSWIITELLIGAIYCVFGLAMLSMCINLIQDEISAKFHWIAAKLGVSRRAGLPRGDDDEDDDDDDDDNEDESSSGDEDDDEDDEDEEDTGRSKSKPASSVANKSARINGGLNGGGGNGGSFA